MLKRQATTKLPTLHQYLKAENLKSAYVSSEIERVFWSDDWKTITFQTTDFRYSLKADSEEDYKSAIDEVLDAIIPNHPMHCIVVYNGDDDGTVEIEFNKVDNPKLNLPYKFIRQFDWGLTLEQQDLKKLPASKKKPSSKMSPDAPPSRLDPTL